MNFPADLPIHDVRYVGEGFRERERIGRKRNRWVKRLSAMPPAERQVIREALADVDRASTHTLMRTASVNLARLEAMKEIEYASRL